MKKYDNEKYLKFDTKLLDIIEKPATSLSFKDMIDENTVFLDSRKLNYIEAGKIFDKSARFYEDK